MFSFNLIPRMIETRQSGAGSECPVKWNLNTGHDIFCPVQTGQDDFALWPRGLVPVLTWHTSLTFIPPEFWICSGRLFFSTPGTLHPCHLLGTLPLSTFIFLSCMNCGENENDARYLFLCPYQLQYRLQNNTDWYVFLKRCTFWW